MAKNDNILRLLIKNSTNQRGVSLAELAISVSIIGIMLAGVLGGMNVIKASNLRRVVTEFTTYKQAVDNFVTQYGYLPGDIPTAYSFWGATCGANTSGAAGSCNGSGDGTIAAIQSGVTLPYEDLLAWKHLALAGLIGGSFTGTNIDGSTRYKLDVNAPASAAITDSIYSFAFQGGASVIYSTTGHAFHFGTITTGNPTSAAMLSKDAYAIDKKIDDGLASYGNLYTIRAGSGCVDAVSSAASANYDFSSTVKGCHLLYWYKKS